MTDKGQVPLSDGTVIEWDAPTETADRQRIRAEFFRSIGPRPYRVLLPHRRAAKAASLQTRYEARENSLARDSNRYQECRGCYRHRNID